MIQKEPVPELHAGTRWPWVLIAVLLIGGVIVALRISRRSGADSAPLTAQAAAEQAGKTAAPSAQEPSVPEVKPTNIVEAAPTPAVVSTDVVQSVESVKALLTGGQLVAARERALASLESAGPEARQGLETLIGQINTNLVFSQAPMPEKTNHVIQAGESLDAIARRYKTTMDLVQASNGIADVRRIRKGDTLRILTGTFRIEVARNANTLVLYHNNRFFKRYVIGTGKHEKTPLGTFTVVDRIRDPVWWRPDGKQIPYGSPENILGTRWLALKASAGTAEVKGYGIHGTWEDGSVGKAESAGCIRMRNRDVEELFTMVPIGTVVQIVDK